MTTLKIPDRAHERGVSLESSAKRIRGTLTGFMTPAGARNALGEIERMREVLAVLEPQLRGALREA